MSEVKKCNKMKQATFYQRMLIITTQHLRRKLPQLTNNVQENYNSSRVSPRVLSNATSFKHT